MKKLVVGLMIGLLVTTQTVNAEAATTGLYQGKVVRMEGKSAETSVSGIQMAGTGQKKPVLKYTAKLSVTGGIVGGMTLTCSSIATNKSTGGAVFIDSIKTVASMECTDGTVTSKTKTTKDSSSCVCSFYKAFYRVDIKRYSGKHTFKNKGYTTKTLSTSKVQK